LLGEPPPTARDARVSERSCGVSAMPAEDARLKLDLRLFFAYRVLSTAYLFVPVLVLFFQERGLDFTQIALLNSVYALTAILCEVPTGVLADRFGRRRAMIAGALLMAVGCLVDFRGASFWAFAVGEGLLALGLTLSSGADSAYLYDLLRDAGRLDRYRALEGRATAGKLIGAAAALVVGGLVGRHHLADTYAVSAFVCLFAALIAALLGERDVDAPATERDLWSAIGGAARVVLRRAPLRRAVLFSVLTFTLLRMGLYLQPTWLDATGLDVAWIGAVLAGLSVVGAVGAERIEALRRALGERALVIVLPLSLGVGYLVLAYVGLGGGLVVLALAALANGIYSPLSKDLLNREITDSSQRATVLSVESMARRLAFGAFAPLAGLLIDKNGLGAGLELTGLCGFAGALALLVYALVRRGAFTRELGAEPELVGAALTPEAARRRV
jgi:predicted MFS family arabinose efflux permease